MELNPVWAGMVKKAWDYRWSSAAVHSGVENADAVVDLAAWRERMPGKEWQATLRAAARAKGALDAVRRGTRSGRPLGSDRFVSKIEHLLGRRVRALPVGRQKGWRKSTPKKASKARK
ncbi:MAG: hypothetical protein GWP08_17785 [Nitrospiraceae bacterium]|nr:hypothetical protein [Nitrospiraceae bacterium]